MVGKIEQYLIVCVIFVLLMGVIQRLEQRNKSLRLAAIGVMGVMCGALTFFRHVAGIAIDSNALTDVTVGGVCVVVGIYYWIKYYKSVKGR